MFPQPQAWSWEAEYLMIEVWHQSVPAELTAAKVVWHPEESLELSCWSTSWHIELAPPTIAGVLMLEVHHSYNACPGGFVGQWSGILRILSCWSDFWAAFHDVLWI
jgi:hypothetical protein